MACFAGVRHNGVCLLGWRSLNPKSEQGTSARSVAINPVVLNGNAHAIPLIGRIAALSGAATFSFIVKASDEPLDARPNVCYKLVFVGVPRNR